VSTSSPAELALDTITPDPEPIMRVASGFMAAKHLFAASEAGLFAALADGPASAGELAERTGLTQHGARISANAMVALGLLETDGNAYRNAPETDFFLAGKTPADLRPFLRFWDRLSVPAWSDLGDALRGQAPARTITSDEMEIFSLGVESITAGPAHATAAQPEIAQARRLLDVGGGTGSFLSAALHANPELTGTLVELPEVAVLARDRLANEPRAEVVAADAIRDPLPAGHDLILVANLVHLLSDEDNRALMRKLHEPGATLMLVDFWTDPTGTDPPPAALMAGEFLLWSGGKGRSYAEIEAREWLAEAGWTTEERRPLAGPQSVIVARAG
jgi:O-methyltransferase domain/Dimerisation domain